MRLFSALSALMFSLFVVPHLPAADLKVGDDAPDFELVGSDGKTYKLSDFKGKQAVVVAWYPKAFTGGCTKECASFAKDGKLLRAFNVAYFTASTDAPELNKKFAESDQIKADYPILSDPGGKVATAYGIYNGKNATRVTFIIDKNGKIADIDTKVNTESHAADVAGKLKKLGVEEKK
jgi:thioredoxin-dependent peroxiredoxin